MVIILLKKLLFSRVIGHNVLLTTSISMLFHYLHAQNTIYKKQLYALHGLMVSTLSMKLLYLLKKKLSTMI